MAPSKPDLSHIAPALRKLARPIDSLHLDPDNARTHDDRNVGTIQASLRQFGQVAPIIARKSDGRIAAGNGRLMAMRALIDEGDARWIKAAVLLVEMDDLTFRQFSLLDNRSAELAGWELKTLSDNLRHLMEAEISLQGLGWEEHEFGPLLDATFPHHGNGDGDDGNQGQGLGDLEDSRTLKFTMGQWKTIEKAVEHIQDARETDLDPSLCVCLALEEWLSRKPKA